MREFDANGQGGPIGGYRRPDPGDPADDHRPVTALAASGRAVVAWNARRGTVIEAAVRTTVGGRFVRMAPLRVASGRVASLESVTLAPDGRVGLLWRERAPGESSSSPGLARTASLPRGRSGWRPGPTVPGTLVDQGLGGAAVAARALPRGSTRVSVRLRSGGPWSGAQTLPGTPVSVDVAPDGHALAVTRAPRAGGGGTELRAFLRASTGPAFGRRPLPNGLANQTIVRVGSGGFIGVATIPRRDAAPWQLWGSVTPVDHNVAAFLAPLPPIIDTIGIDSLYLGDGVVGPDGTMTASADGDPGPAPGQVAVVRFGALGGLEKEQRGWDGCRDVSSLLLATSADGELAAICSSWDIGNEPGFLRRYIPH